jgi:hypothetical protein
MWFLLRMTFWLGIVLVLLPSVGSQPVPKSQVSTSEALWAAKVVATDIQHFCERQREACVVGSQATVTLGQRAQAGAKMLYEFLSEQFASNESRPTPTTDPVPAPPARLPPQTLRPADLVPPWRGPQPTETPREKQPGEGRTLTVNFFGAS